MHPQMPLALNGAAHSFDSYFAGPAGAPMLAAVCGLFEQHGQQVYLWGAHACGKTHLLSAACARALDAGRRVAFVPLEQTADPALFEAIENASLVCIDNLQALPEASEPALFHAINSCRSAGTCLLFSAALPPPELNMKLADLRTRLAWGAVFHLPEPDEARVRGALGAQLQARGLCASEAVLDFMLRRLPRDLPTLMRWVDALDHTSLSYQRRLTIPLVRELLQHAPDYQLTESFQ